MEEEKSVETTVTTEKPKKIKPEIDFKKEIKDLRLENTELKAKLEAAQNIITSLKIQSEQNKNYADKLALNYHNITKYIMDATNVFYKGIAMAVKKEDE